MSQGTDWLGRYIRSWQRRISKVRAPRCELRPIAPAAAWHYPAQDQEFGGDCVFRSVKESRRLTDKSRWLYRAEGLAVAGVVCAAVILGFAWLMSPPG